ncbi:GD24224 [Drosophila simulans]|uniref:GD24224 n=1 Tax=Drosophila simulans TaxID=7240 RepID=B4QA09_DROSI|nr:GD24224 [Drosophila simulans]
MPWKAKHNEISINIQNLDDTESEVKKIKLPQGTKSLELHAKGTGPAFIQISYRYNVLKKQSHPSFKVQVTVLPEITPPKLKLNLVEAKNEDSIVAVYLKNLPKNDIKCIPIESYGTHKVDN